MTTNRWDEVTDADLVRAATAGEPAAFTALHDRHAPRIYSRFLYELRDVDDAKDATQETFVDAWRGLHQLQDPQALPAWLGTIADRRAMKSRKQRDVYGAVLMAGGDPLGDVPDPSPTPDHALVRDEARQLVRDALEGVQPRYQEVLRFTLEHGKAGAGLGTALGVSPEQASRLADKAMHSLAGAVAALILARTGRPGCRALDQLLRDSSWAGEPLSPELRTKVQRHAGRCETCGQRRHAVGRKVIASLPAVFPLVVPLDLRDRILEGADVAAAAGSGPLGQPADRASSPPSGGPEDLPRPQPPVGRPGLRSGGTPKWVPALAAGAGVAILAGGFLLLRDGDGGSARDATETGEVGAAPAGEDLRPPDLDLTGIVVASEETQIAFVDPETGATRTTLDLGRDHDELESWTTPQGPEPPRIAREAFSDDWAYVAGTGVAALGDVTPVWVSELDPATGRYEELLSIDGAGEASYSSEPIEYRNPRFAPGGETLWFESRPEGADEVTLVSIHVPTYQEGDEPASSGVTVDASDSLDQWMLDEEGEPVLLLPDDRQTIYDPESEEPLFGNRDANAHFWTDASGTAIGASIHLPVGDPEDCTELAREGSGDYLVSGCADAALARVSIDPGDGTVESTTLVPLGAEGSPDAVVLSPEHREALLYMGGTWYRADLEAPRAEPRPAEDIGLDFRGLDSVTGPLIAWE